MNNMLEIRASDW